ncbi:acyl-CoA thioesterase [Natronomonas sp.]|uniref:acyl-CoA thioesterase n=1 Tax=Natronomonas sp. TaxID=2184060 RepID=UPI002610167A|nr:thioesterase family protein [Natronomonas sp.]
MGFRFDTEVRVRYRDLDTLEHVNNALYATYLEEARFRYFEHVLGVSLEEGGAVLANLTIDFARPVTRSEETVRIACGATEVGDSSVRMGYRVYPGGGDETVATAETVVVAVEEGTSREIPQAWRTRFSEFEPEL